MCGVWPGIIISSGPKTARQSVEHLIFSTENNQNILREDCSSQVLPFIQQRWHFNAMAINTGIYPSHQCFQWGEEAKVRWEATDVAYKVTGVCELHAIWALSGATKNRAREERHGNETPHAYIVAKYDKLESWRKTEVWYMAKNISAKMVNL